MRRLVLLQNGCLGSQGCPGGSQDELCWPQGGAWPEKGWAARSRLPDWQVPLWPDLCSLHLWPWPLLPWWPLVWGKQLFLLLLSGVLPRVSLQGRAGISSVHPPPHCGKAQGGESPQVGFFPAPAPRCYLAAPTAPSCPAFVLLELGRDGDKGWTPLVSQAAWWAVGWSLPDPSHLLGAVSGLWGLPEAGLIPDISENNPSPLSPLSSGSLGPRVKGRRR